MVSTIFNHHIKVHPTSCQRSALQSVQDVHWHGERHVPALEPRRSYRHRLKVWLVARFILDLSPDEASLELFSCTDLAVSC